VNAPRTFFDVVGLPLPAESRWRQALAVFSQGSGEQLTARAAEWEDLERVAGVASEQDGRRLFADHARAVAEAFRSTVAPLKVDPPPQGLKTPWKASQGRFLRVDMASANWSALRRERAGLPETFAAFATSRLATPRLLAESKCFRQHYEPGGLSDRVTRRLACVEYGFGPIRQAKTSNLPGTWYPVEALQLVGTALGEAAS